MVCIQCYLPPIMFMVYMKLIHPFLAPFLEPAIDRVVAMIWGPEAVTRGCPIRPKSGSSNSTNSDRTAPVAGTSTDGDKPKED